MAKNITLIIALLLAGLSGFSQQKSTTETVAKTVKTSESEPKFSEKQSKNGEKLNISLTEEEIQKCRMIEYEIDAKKEKQLKSNKLNQAEKDRVIREFDIMKQKLLIETLGQEHYEIYKAQF